MANDALRHTLCRAIVANRVSILGNKLTTKRRVARKAREAVFVPLFPERGSDDIINIPVAPCANPSVNALLVERFAILNHVLASNSTSAFSARKEFTSTVLAQWASAMIKERATKSFSTIIASEMVSVERFPNGTNVLPIEVLAALVAALISTPDLVSSRTRAYHFALTCVVAHIST